MQLIPSLLVLSLVICSVLGTPIPRRKQVRSFKVPRVRRSDYVPNGPAALRRAYAKFGIIPSTVDFGGLDFTPLPPGSNREAVSKATQPNENGVVTNTPTRNDVQYLSPVTIGGQEFVMNLDTGSSNTWVFNTQLDERVTAGHAVFDPANSTTFTELEGFTFNITYGDSSFASGSVGVDTVDIGGATVEKQSFGLPTEVSASFAEDQDSDGLVGMGFSKINTVQPEPQTSFFDNLAPDLEEPVFTAQLRSGEDGSYEFGTVDRSKFTGELLEFPVDSSGGFWEVQSSMYRIGNNDTIETVSQGINSAIVDTGTTLLLVNDEIVEAYYANVENSQFSGQAGGFIYPCDTTLPDLWVSVADTHLVRVAGRFVNFAPVGVDTSNGAELCMGGIQSNQGSGLQVWGDVFLKSVFTVFDHRGPTLKLAAHAPLDEA